MSRARNSADHNAVQLFPFVAVLLCTMGSLMVLLVVLTRSSRVHAIEAASAVRAAEVKAALSPAAELATKKKLEQVAQFQAELDTVRRQAADKLHEDQSRLSHLEDHMQRLREQLDSLKLAAAELNSLEGSRFDDRKQAEREVERLQQLIDESHKSIDELRAEMKRRPKSYAIVPYQGPSGTVRRPIYIECREKEVVLQPEGVVFTAEDFQMPIGPGNPLVASIRAAREYILRNEVSAAAGSDTEPYPLIIVRPKGILMYFRVREAIQSWDSEFGYELVEEDWDLKYAPAQPSLASLEYQAAELARNRLRALADAAPGAYGAYRSSGGGYDDDEEVDESPNASYGGADATGSDGSRASFVVGNGGGLGTSPDGSALDFDGRGAGAVNTNGYAGQDGGSPGVTKSGDKLADGQNVGSGSGQGAGGNGQVGSVDAQGAGSSPGASSEGAKHSGEAQSAANPSTGNSEASDRYANSASESSSAQATNGQAGPSGQAGGPPADSSAAQSQRGAGEDPDAALDRLARKAAGGNAEEGLTRPQATKSRGKNWAIDSAGPGMIPIRRTIQIVVRQDAVAILPEQMTPGVESLPGREFQFQNGSEYAYENTLSALETEIKSWGMAGNGLYWKPVVDLKVGAGGERRASDLVRLLKTGGFEVRNGSLARQNEGGTSGAKR